MIDISFVWSGIGPPDILSKTFTKVSVVQKMHVNPLQIIIWMSSGSGLRIQSRMHDIAERHEVGVLEFSQVKQPDWDSYLETVELAKEFQDKVRIDKLVLETEGMRIECGLALEGSRGGTLAIAPSDYPGALAIQGTGLRFRFGPEYQLEQYVKVPL